MDTMRIAYQYLNRHENINNTIRFLNNIVSKFEEKLIGTNKKYAETLINNITYYNSIIDNIQNTYRLILDNKVRSALHINSCESFNLRINGCEPIFFDKFDKKSDSYIFLLSILVKYTDYIIYDGRIISKETAIFNFNLEKL